MKIVILSVLLVALVVSTEAMPDGGPMFRKAKECKEANCSSLCGSLRAIMTKMTPCRDVCTGAPKKFISQECRSCAHKNGKGGCYDCMQKCAKDIIEKFTKG